MLPECPRLRPFLNQATSPHDPDHIYVVDRLGLAGPTPLRPAEFAWLEFLDGQHSFSDIQARATRQLGGVIVSAERVRD